MDFRAEVKQIVSCPPSKEKRKIGRRIRDVVGHIELQGELRRRRVRI